MQESHQEEHSTQWEHQKQGYHQSVCIEGLNVGSSRKLPTLSGTARTYLRRKILSRILEKTYVKKLVNKCSCVLKN